MILTLLDWLGTAFILVGAFIFTSKKVTESKWRKKALYSYATSNLFWGIMSFTLGLWGMFFTQIVLSLINMRGLYNNKKEKE